MGTKAADYEKADRFDEGLAHDADRKAPLSAPLVLLEAPNGMPSPSDRECLACLMAFRRGQTSDLLLAIAMFHPNKTETDLRCQVRMDMQDATDQISP